ncbi:MAG: ATP-binding protein [Anaerolineales bacterium]|nr:ATP-binding protein [Anaerolineales bacterium]
MTQRTLEILESLMAGHDITPSEIDGLLNDRVSEDLHLDYKHGNELEEKKKPSRTIRQYLSGFANSAGGVLIVGVDQDTWSVTGCSAPGGGDLAEWAARCTTPIAHHFSPPPRFCVVKHPKGDILVASTDRSLGLVPCIEEGRPIYYFRFHDETLMAPEYLVSDILLGRRQQPYYRIANSSLIGLSLSRPVGTGYYDLYFSLQFTCENDSLFRSDDIRVGIVGWSEGGSSSLSNHLLSYLEVREVNKQKYSGRRTLVHVVKEYSGIGPFDIGNFNRIGEYAVPLSVNDQWFIPYKWKAALYLMSDKIAPTWYQLSVTINQDLLRRIKDGTGLESVSEFIETKRMSGERPVVEWEYK